jgi:ABC-type transport system substrate-binding protein
VRRDAIRYLPSSMPSRPRVLGPLPAPARRALLALALAAAALAPRPATAEKVIRYAFQIAETGFDPAQESDRYSAFVNEAIFSSPLTYDYLARPAKLVPQTLVAMPEASDQGATYVLRVRPGILFADDPAFEGRPRELTAEDYAYSIERLYDPRTRSPVLFLVEGKIRGLDALRRRALQEGGRFDYGASVEGLEVLDRYTLRIRLTRPDYTFLYVLATPSLGAVAREVVERYGNDLRHHPVGTGPFRLAAYKPSSRIVLERNPRYRHTIPPPVPGDDPDDQAIAARLAGKQLPLVDRVEISIIDEQQPRWLAFLNGEHDYVEDIASEFVQTAAPGGKLAASLARQGIQLWQLPDPELVLTCIYNMRDPVVGGYEPAKVALRRALNLAYDTPADAFIARQGQVVIAEGVVPPGVAGHDPTFRGVANEHDPARAKALLDLFGYVDRDGDGWRDLPDGSPLALTIASPPDAKSKQYDEIWHKSLTAVGVRVSFRKMKWPDLVKTSRLGQLQMGHFLAWHADYPDAENFFQLLYGKNIGQSNDAHFDLPAFNRLYEASLLLPDSPERTRIYARMNELVVAYAPWKLGFHRIRTHMAHAWVRNYRKHPILHHGWMYLDVDEAAAGKPLARK